MSAIQHHDFDAAISQLPIYARSLLKIKLPVVVTLASSKQPISRIVELGPGSLIQFDKSCEEMLTLEIDGRKVAVGEAIKVGDKFGLRVTSITMPHERFRSLRDAKVRSGSVQSSRAVVESQRSRANSAQPQSDVEYSS